MPAYQDNFNPAITVAELEFSDGSRLTFEPTDIVLVVGPNNAGKSATLRAIRDKLSNPAVKSPVIRSVTVTKRGSAEEFTRWIETWTKRLPENSQDPVYAGVGQNIQRSQINVHWQRGDNALGPLARWMCHFLSADERLGICNPPGHISLTQQGPSHPIHHLQRDDDLEKSLSAKFRRAFSVDFVVHRNAGSNVPLHVGDRPSLRAGEDRVSLSYIERLETLPQLQTQGDGMRSFAGVLLATSVGRETVMLIDEPEAFLHPPQAKLLGTFLVEGRGDSRQLFIATHSTDILRGVLDANSPAVKVLRVRRQGEVNAVRFLHNQRIKELWGDPLLRYSNILDGLFHEVAVICEGDADCRFYSAVLDATLASDDSDTRRPDVFFTHCGGKARLPLVVRALREVDVPVRAVADFDILADEQPLRSVVEALGSDWASVEPDWRTVKASVDAKRPDLNTADVKREVDRILGTTTSSILPEKVRTELQSVLKRSTAWSNAKLIGKAFVPSGEPTRACERLLGALRSFGLHVVEVGELEGFCRTVDGHGPKWVNLVLARDLAHDPELASAREFAKRLTGT
jgi:predicted ATPase